MHYDHHRGCMRHSPIGSVKPNVYATYYDRQAFIWVDATPHCLLIDLFTQTLIGAEEDSFISPLVVKPGRGESLTLSTNGRYLCAEEDGAISFDRLMADNWENFVLLSQEQFDILSFIITNRWLSVRSGIVVAPACVSGPGLTFGDDASVSVQMLLDDVARSQPAANRLPREISIRTDGWKLEHCVLYRPLAVYVAYGREATFACAEIAIKSLFEFGGWTGDVLVVTDADNQNFIDRMSADLRSRIRMACISASDTLDFTLSRYKIINLKILNYYRQIIYIDIDIVCDAPLDIFTKRISCSRDLHVYAEGPLGPTHYFGKTLLEKDNTPLNSDDLGFSTGFIAFCDADQHRAIFLDTIDAAYEYKRKELFVFDVYDQPFFNYIVCKKRYPIGRMIQDVLQIHKWYIPYNSVKPIGFVHFAGGVGSSEPKLEVMSKYYEHLLDRKASL